MWRLSNRTCKTRDVGLGIARQFRCQDANSKATRGDNVIVRDTIEQLEFFECGESGHDVGVGYARINLVKRIHNNLRWTN